MCREFFRASFFAKKLFLKDRAAKFLRSNEHVKVNIFLPKNSTCVLEISSDENRLKVFNNKPHYCRIIVRLLASNFSLDVNKPRMMMHRRRRVLEEFCFRPAFPRLFGHEKKIARLFCSQTYANFSSHVSCESREESVKICKRG